MSDHTENNYTSYGAIALGASIIEKHYVDTKKRKGPDVSSSITINELNQLVDGVRFIEKTMKHNVEKDSISDELKVMRQTFRKSIVYSMNMRKGDLINRNNVSFKKPGTGIDQLNIEKVLGKKLKRNVKTDELLSMDDLT